ncbi:uncharacterized protein LOC123292977 [Chrysoperla carnea]|uniref:uncharacterized protein LOC123292977 n=1 Tax=Chrysoperla carnea TaxID=189513 RepID=UPI001D06B8AE|nr:uncharacterized protein LOC123292977 [Chrysoperla carnea]
MGSRTKGLKNIKSKDLTSSRSKDLTNNKQKDLSDVYNDIGLTVEQKKQLHFMVLRVQDLVDVKALSNISYNEIEDLKCCNDPMCVCGSSMKPLRQRLAEEALRNYPTNVIDEIKNKTHAVIHYSEKLEKLKEEVGAEYILYENRREEHDLRELLHEYKTRIKDIVFELNLTNKEDGLQGL